MLWLIPFEVDPNSVRAGWLPLLIVIGIGVLLVGLYLSMRHEMGKISVPTVAELAAAEQADDQAPSAVDVTAEDSPRPSAQ